MAAQTLGFWGEWGNNMQFWQHLLLGVALATLALPANAISVAADDWTYTLNDNITNAGDYYADTLTTSTKVSISGTSSGLQAWTLFARLTTSASGLTIATKCDEENTTCNSVNSITSAGSDGYQTLTTAFLPLFSGSGDISDIPLKYRISNFDVTDGNGIKNIQIEYQITTQ